MSPQATGLRNFRGRWRGSLLAKGNCPPVVANRRRERSRSYPGETFLGGYSQPPFHIVIFDEPTGTAAKNLKKKNKGGNFGLVGLKKEGFFSWTEMNDVPFLSSLVDSINSDICFHRRSKFTISNDGILASKSRGLVCEQESDSNHSTKVVSWKRFPPQS